MLSMAGLPENLGHVAFVIQGLLEDLGPRQRSRAVTEGVRYAAVLEDYERTTGLDLPAMAAAIAAGYPEQVYGG